MFYVRSSSHEHSQQLVGSALSILWMVVHSVHGIMFKDLKQILRKEQCDASILLTANIPSAKKIIVHGPEDRDEGGIPSQFPVQEDTQFLQLWRESLDFFGIEERDHPSHFLIDYKTRKSSPTRAPPRAKASSGGERRGAAPVLPDQVLASPGGCNGPPLIPNLLHFVLSPAHKNAM